jgi:hypothetical protein
MHPSWITIYVKKACLKIVVFSWYIRKSLPFVSRFTSILMLEGSQLRLLNNISLLSVYLSQLNTKRLRPVTLEIQVLAWHRYNNVTRLKRLMDPNPPHTLSKFKKAICSSVSMPIPRHYSYGSWKLNIILTQLRCKLPFVSRFTSILMLEGSQLRLLNNISLLSVYLSQSKKKWWEFSHGASHPKYDYLSPSKWQRYYCSIL